LMVGGNVLLAVFLQAFALHVMERQPDIAVGQLPRRQRTAGFIEIQHIAF
jgi:hypothetical protein